MADAKSLVIYSGRITQILDADSLIVGSGIKSPSGINLTITPGGTDVVIGANKNLSAAAGTGAFDFSGASGTFKTSTGAVTIGPGVVTVSGVTTFTAAGTALTVNNNALVSGWLYADGGIDRSSAGTLVVGGANSTTVGVGTNAATTTVNVGGSGTTTMNLGTGAAMTTLSIGTGTGATDNIYIGGAGSMTTIGGDLTVSGNEYVTGTSEFTGDSVFKGNVDIGDGTGTDLLTFTSSAFTVGDILPNVTQTDSLGDSSHEWLNIWAVNMTLSGALIIEDLTVNGDTVLGDDAASDTVTFDSRVNSGIIPTPDATQLLGEDSTPLRWLDVASITFTASSVGDATQQAAYAYNGITPAFPNAGTTYTIKPLTQVSGAGNPVAVGGGNGDATSAGGNLTLTGGNGGATSGAGGNVYVRGGSAASANNYGVVYIGDTNTVSVEIGSATATTNVNGDLVVDDDTTLGASSADTVTFNAQIASSMIPNADVTYDLGEDTTPLRWADIYTGGSLYASDAKSAGNYTEFSAGTIYSTGSVPLNITNGAAAVAGIGSYINVKAGQGNGAGDGGPLTLSGGDAGTTSGTGGVVTIRGGNSATSGVGGSVHLEGGTGTTNNGSINIGYQNTYGITLGQGTTLAGSSYIQVQNGWVLNVPTGASFALDGNLNGSDVDATKVTGTNLNTLTNGSNADLLHTHAAGSATYIAFSATSGEAITQYAPVALDYDGSSNPRIYQADCSGGNGTSGTKDIVGISLTAAGSSGVACNVQVCGEVSAPTGVWDGGAPAATDVGKRVYLSTANGKITLTAPATTGDNVIRVGWVSVGGANPKIVIDIGEGVIL